MTNPTIYSGSERILKAGVFCTLLDLTLTYEKQETSDYLNDSTIHYVSVKPIGGLW